MTGAALHLNLLKDSERRSSSPVRLRVMMPLLAMLATIGALVWWGTNLTQLVIVKTQADSLDADIKSKSREHAEAIRQQGEVRETQLGLDQLEFYRTGVRHIAEPLAKLAEVMPIKVQLTGLSVSRLPPQNLARPKGVKGPPLWGPPTNVETQKFVVAGRTTKAPPLSALMESLDGPGFEGLAGTAGDPATGRKGTVVSFRQDSAPAKDGSRLLTFEVEYVMPERRFAK